MSSLKINPLKDWKSISYMERQKLKRLKNFHGISLDLMNFSGKNLIKIVGEDFEEEWTADRKSLLKVATRGWSMASDADSTKLEIKNQLSSFKMIKINHYIHVCKVSRFCKLLIHIQL